MKNLNKLTLNQETIRTLNAGAESQRPQFGTFVNCCTCFLSCPECNPPQYK
jgi:hypothetical protein